jgi:siroheme synthase (precorrin-2 oxidase/ferrochelatase)
MNDQGDKLDLSRLIKCLMRRYVPIAVNTSGYSMTEQVTDQIVKALRARYDMDLEQVTVSEVDDFLQRRFVRLAKRSHKYALRQSWRSQAFKLRKKR